MGSYDKILLLSHPNDKLSASNAKIEHKSTICTEVNSLVFFLIAALKKGGWQLEKKRTPHMLPDFFQSHLLGFF